MKPQAPGYESRHRLWNPHFQRAVVKIQPGECYVTRKDEIILTVLGSCVSACVRCPLAGVGGMNHFMLPKSQTGTAGRWGRTGINSAMRYGNYAMEYLLNEVLKHGGCRECLEIKIVGGGQILKQGTDVGRRNIAFVRAYLREENLSVAAEDMGDIHPRKVYYDPKSGKVRVKKLRSLRHQQIIASETRYQEALRTQPDYGEVELFE